MNGLFINGPAPVSAIPQIEDSSPNPATDAPQSAVTTYCCRYRLV